MEKRVTDVNYEIKKAVLLLFGLIIAVIVLIWALRRIFLNLKARRFIEEAYDVHNLAFTEEREVDRAKARQRFEEMAREAIKSNNRYINNRSVAETLIGYASFVARISHDGEASDAEEAARWGERVIEVLQPMLYKGMLK